MRSKPPIKLVANKVNMISRKSFIVLTFSIAIFASGRIEQLIAKGQATSDIAWAQDATDANDGGVVSSDRDEKNPSPNLTGNWVGELEDNTLGESQLNLEMGDKKGKLKGGWGDDSVGGGMFKGKVKGDKVTFTFKSAKKGCEITAAGTLDDPTLIEDGTFKSKGCAEATSGEFFLELQDTD
jgi:hypothetical protein